MHSAYIVPGNMDTFITRTTFTRADVITRTFLLLSDFSCVDMQAGTIRGSESVLLMRQWHTPLPPFQHVIKAAKRAMQPYEAVHIFQVRINSCWSRKQAIHVAMWWIILTQLPSVQWGLMWKGPAIALVLRMIAWQSRPWCCRVEIGLFPQFLEGCPSNWV